MSLWRRLGRLWGQSRIRLPKADLDAAQLRVGDRLQIGGELWRVVARASSSPSAAFALENFVLENHALPSRRAELRCDGPRWELVEDATAVGLARSEILVFPVGEARSGSVVESPARGRPTGATTCLPQIHRGHREH